MNLKSILKKFSARNISRTVVYGIYRILGSLVRYKTKFQELIMQKKFDEKLSSQGVRNAVNPFIALELGRLNLRSAPISTSLRETYAQCNEDIIIESLLRARLMGEGRSLSSVRYLEIGGNHPVQTSSSYLLYRAWGAQGLLVEAEPTLAKRLQAIRPRDKIIDFAISDQEAPTLNFYIHESNELSSLSIENIANFERFGGTNKIIKKIQVPNLHINALFERFIDEPLDFMSIDIEGLDVAVLRAMHPDIRPTIIQAEWAGIGSLLDDFNDILQPRGYVLVGLSDVNAIFVTI